MKKVVICTLCLLLIFLLPVACFADSGTPGDENTVMRILNIIWYVILAVLFGGGLILVSKWSQKINERDAELERKLQEQQLAPEDDDEEQEPLEDAHQADPPSEPANED